MKATTEQIQKMTNFLTSKANERLLKSHSCWKKGVIGYYLSDLIDKFKEICEEKEGMPDTTAELKKWILNGAASWTEYSYGGCSLIYDSDIAETLCTPSELKRNKHGERKPNRDEEWLDVQARALWEAFWHLRLYYQSYYAKNLDKGKEGIKWNY